MEPHIAAVFHAENPDQAPEDVRFKSYVEYGRRFEQLLKDILKDIGRNVVID